MSTRKGKDEDSEASKPSKTQRPTYWYDINEVIEEPICPSCGRPMTKFKNRCAHIKRCFAIRKLGPIYRIKGYRECKCGMLINDIPKAQKLHVCAGEVPAFEPNISYNPPVLNEKTPTVKKELPTSPIKPKYRVRNFDMPVGIHESDEDCDVYSIKRQDGDIIVAVKCSKLMHRPATKSTLKRLIHSPRSQNDVS